MPCAFIALAALGVTGCATVVVPPHPVANPAKVGILDHGRHSSLLIEVPDGGMVRYGYGDWRWYAEDKTDFFDGVRALFWPTEAAIGRRYFKASFNSATIAKDVGLGVERAHVFEVERERVASLIRALDGIFALNMATRIDNPSSDLELVRHPENYSAANNSNQMVGRWVEELGARLEGKAVWSEWRLAPPAGSDLSR